MTAVITALENKQAITDLDEAAIDMLANNYNIFILASEQVNRDGIMLEGKIHPAFQIACKAQTQALSIISKFGLTTKDRNKIPQLSEGETTPLNEFLKGDKVETR